MWLKGGKVLLIFPFFLICAGGKKRKSHNGWPQLSNINIKNQYFMYFFNDIPMSNNATLGNTTFPKFFF